MYLEIGPGLDTDLDFSGSSNPDPVGCFQTWIFFLIWIFSGFIQIQRSRPVSSNPDPDQESRILVFFSSGLRGNEIKCEFSWKIFIRKIFLSCGAYRPAPQGAYFSFYGNFLRNSFSCGACRH